MDNERFQNSENVLTDIQDRLDRIEKNIGGLGISVNSVVDTVNQFLSSAQTFMSSGALGKLGSMFGSRGGDENG